MLKETIGYSTVLILLLFPSNVFSTNFPTACDLLKLPRECHCQRTRHVFISSSNETRLRCRQLTEITTSHRWSIVPYDRLVFETSNDNLTLNRFAFADIIVRTLRFNVQNLVLNDHTFDNAYIGQLVISHQDTYGRISFEHNGQIFYGTTITNLYFRSINFQTKISELIFSNARIYTLIIQSSKFYGFTNKNSEINFKNETILKYDHFLEYDSIFSTNQKKIPRQSSSDENDPDQTVIMNITSINYPIFITIYTILSSINTTNLTENYFPNNLEYSQTSEIELSYNQIDALDAHAFRHLRQFQGSLLLKNNQIKYLNPSVFDDLILLKNLSLRNNFIQNISTKHFENLEQLYELDLSFNLIYQLDNNTFEYLVNLHILQLNNNPLEVIHSDAFANLMKLKQISFQDVPFIHLIDQQYFGWIWNLASLHVRQLLNTNFDLSDVAFCILTRYNETLFHLSRQHSCSCNIHYLYRNEDFSQKNFIPISKYNTNYLRLTPICHQNDTESRFEQSQNTSEQLNNENDLILQDLEDKCDYQLMFLDCNAMTTTTQMTTIGEIEIENTLDEDILDHSTTEIQMPTTTIWLNKHSPTTTKPLNNMKKLFTVLGTLIGITVVAIIFVFFWYRFKSMIKRKQKKKNFVEQQRQLNSPINNNHHSTSLRYASSDILGSLCSEQLSPTKSQSHVLIEPLTTPSSLSPIADIYTNIEAIDSEPIEDFIDDENLYQNSMNNRTTQIQTVTKC